MRFIATSFRSAAHFQRGSFLGLLLLSGLAARAQAPTWQQATAVAVATSAYSNVAAMTTDAAGNVYLAGSFQGTVSFGALSLTSAGNDDIYVAKWNPVSRTFMWVQRAGGSADDHAVAIAVSGSNVYVAGDFKEVAAFGGTTLTNGGDYGNVFVAKLTDAGTSAAFTWAQNAAGDDDDYATAIAVNGPNVYVTGGIESAAVTFGSTTLTNPRGGNVFVAKLTDAGSTGSFTWAQQSTNTSGGINAASSLVVRGADVYVAGAFSSQPVVFGTTTLANATTTDPADSFIIINDAFVAKLTDAGSTGSFAWAQRVGGDGEELAFALAADDAGAYVAGVFTSAQVAFGTTTLTNTAPLTADVFVARFNTGTGEFEWAQRAGGRGDEVVRAMTLANGSLYLAGNYSGQQPRFGATTLPATTEANLLNVFVAKLTPMGEFAWAQYASGGDDKDNDDDEATCLAVSGASVYVGGGVMPPASFGSCTVGPAAGNATGNKVGFLASLTDNAVLATAAPALAAALNLYPNPARTTATVRVPAVAGATHATLTLHDALGRTVHTQRLSLPATGATAELPLRGLAPGLYQLRVQAGPQRLARSLAVE